RVSSARTTAASASRTRRAEATRRRRATLKLRMPRQLDVGQGHPANLELIRAALGGGFEPHGARGRDEVVLVHAVAADPDGAGQPATFIERNAAREDRDPVPQPRLAGHAVRSQQAPLDEVELEPGVEDAPGPD